jgi:hypothetical protein
VTDDLVDVFYRDLVQPLGNLVILFAQAEASLLDLVAAWKDGDEQEGQKVLKAPDAKDQILELVKTSGFEGFELKELLEGVENFWSDRARRNRYIHDEWFPLVDDNGSPATRGLPRKKGSEVVWDYPTPEQVWGLAKNFQDHEHLFSHAVYVIRRERKSDDGSRDGQAGAGTPLMPDPAKPSYTIAQFIAVVEDLRKPTPQSDELPLPAGHASFKSQWIGWLEEYLERGYYDRKNAVDDAEWAYNHLNNGRMIVWLNEAAGEDPRIVEAAIVAMDDREPRQTEAKFARRVLPWQDVAKLLFK